jgi:hypothetical protein
MLTFENTTVQSALRCPICKEKMQISYENSGTLYCNGKKDTVMILLRADTSISQNPDKAEAEIQNKP